MITYDIDGKLYLNLTNRCPNNCVFCVRDKADSFNYDLWLKEEPELDEIIKEIGKAEKYDKVIFCGFGEPTVRLPLLLEVAKYLKSLNKKVRLNTNGLSDRIWNKPTAPEMKGLIDIISISLNAADKYKYQERCLSDFGESAFDSVISFARECVKYIPKVVLSVVDVMPEDEIKKCEQIAKEIGAEFRIRALID